MYQESWISNYFQKINYCKRINETYQTVVLENDRLNEPIKLKLRGSPNNRRFRFRSTGLTLLFRLRHPEKFSLSFFI